MVRWKLFGRTDGAAEEKGKHEPRASYDPETGEKRPEKWSLGMLNDKYTDEVPGSVLLMSKVHNRQEPLGLQVQPARTSRSSLPDPNPPSLRSRSRTPTRPDKKRTADGKIILEPQPEESHNDPLNWPLWRRNAALLSLGFYCLVGGGMTPIIAAGFNNVAATYNVTVAKIALTTGLYMMGLGIGGVIMSPTAILFGKRPVYLSSAIAFVLTSVWCALSPNYVSLLVARIFQGIAVSPVECLPSATVAEIFYLHERAYRLGIYTLLLLGGKNLIPLVSAVIIQSLGWRWVFWIVAFTVGFCGTLLFLFVPETFWDRTPKARNLHLPHIFRSHSRRSAHGNDGAADLKDRPAQGATGRDRRPDAHIVFGELPSPVGDTNEGTRKAGQTPRDNVGHNIQEERLVTPLSTWQSPSDWEPVQGAQGVAEMPDLRNLNSPWYNDKAETSNEMDYFTMGSTHGSSPANVPSSAPEPERGAMALPQLTIPTTPKTALRLPNSPRPTIERRVTLPPKPENASYSTLSKQGSDKKQFSELPESSPAHSTHHGVLEEPSPTDKVLYTEYYRSAPAKTYWQTLRPFSGRLCHDNWLRVAFRPFVLYAYPAILWSSVVYSLSVGWLIVLSESVSTIYKSRDTYNFTSLQTGLIYLSPFIGGILGTAVAGRVSDIIVRFMSRRNDGVYEPEYRLVMALPIAITTAMGLMGFGWSAQERDNWIVPTVFFGVISFGCSLGSTTAITFAVDSYRQYAGEALVTLNFSKNIFHGLVFSLFFPNWLEHDGSRKVFIALGGIQLAFLIFTIPMYIFGKRARMWTVRQNFMERF